MRILGIDYGTKRIGLAVSDELKMTARPLCIIENNRELLDAIAKVVSQQEIAEIVIGYSVNQKGEANTLMAEMNDLVGQLSLTEGLPVHFQQEAFSSVEARRLDEGAPEKRNPANPRRLGKEGRAHIDDRAAALILQRFLDKRN